MGSYPEYLDTAVLNAQNHDVGIPSESDVVVVGAGIHSLIYAIHAKSVSLRRASPDTQKPRAITVLEKSETPGYKIGESTLTVFGLWLKTVGISPPLLWRLFGPKDGLAFYYLPFEGDPNAYSSFTANGPPGDFVPTLQIERKISELLLTLHAQRLGVNVLHGHLVDIDATNLSDAVNNVHVKNITNGSKSQIKAKLLVDATGRFRRFASKKARTKRFSGWNTDAFWAYFEEIGDESAIPLDYYESCNTNHICLAEGWAWVIRLPSWEGSPIPNLIAMIEHLLELNSRNAAADEYPSSHELAKNFQLKFRWVVSIGFALRNDVVYPEDLSTYGSCEAERKFNWITKRYPKMQELMNQHSLVKDLYGPKSTWFIRKGLAYQSPAVSGPGWAAIGDATGFTNPLYSPGINANMGTSVFLAENTTAYLTAKNTRAREKILNDYESYCLDRIPNLNRMNVFNYLCMRSPETGPLGPLWQYLCGTGNANWQRIRSFTLDNVNEMVTTWDWGANTDEYIEFADTVIRLLDGPPTLPDAIVVQKVLDLSARAVKDTLSNGKYCNRWAGLLRWYDDELVYHPEKTEKDVLASRCKDCKNWRIFCGNAVKCPTCGAINEGEKVQLYK